MKCEEALTKIEAYINHTLNGRELEEFLEHVTSCQEKYFPENSGFSWCAFFHSDTGSGTFLSGTSGTAQTF